MDNETARFLNVDLDVEGKFDLSPLVGAFEPGVFALHCVPTDTGYRATLELARDPRDAESGILQFLDQIRALPASAKQLWDQATLRTFNIGVQGGRTPRVLELAFSPDLLRAVSEVRARLVLTVYATSLGEACSVLGESK